MARFDDFDDPLSTLEPLIDAAASAQAGEARIAILQQLNEHLTRHFDSVEPTLYAALRPFPQVARSLGQAQRACDEIALELASLSLLPAGNEAWGEMFHALEDVVRQYFEYTEPRLIEAAALCIGAEALHRLGQEAERISRLGARADHVRTFPVHHSESHHG